MPAVYKHHVAAAQEVAAVQVQPVGVDVKQLQKGSLPKAAVVFHQPAHKHCMTAAQEFAAMQVEPVGFEAIADEGSQAEVSRLFSAMLQLINNGNIQILPGQPQQPFQLRLLKTELLHRQFLEGPAITTHASKVMLMCRRVCLQTSFCTLSILEGGCCCKAPNSPFTQCTLPVMGVHTGDAQVSASLSLHGNHAYGCSTIL